MCLHVIILLQFSFYFVIMGYWVYRWSTRQYVANTVHCNYIYMIKTCSLLNVLKLLWTQPHWDVCVVVYINRVWLFSCICHISVCLLVQWHRSHIRSHQNPLKQRHSCRSWWTRGEITSDTQIYFVSAEKLYVSRNMLWLIRERSRLHALCFLSSAQLL